MDIIENRYRMIIEPERSGKTVALKRHYQCDSNLNPAQTFLLNHINSKIPLVIMYVDLVGTINMSMTLPVNKLVSIIRAAAD